MTGGATHTHRLDLDDASIREWDACADATLTLEDFHGARCWIGADLASRDDLAATALLRSATLYSSDDPENTPPLYVVEKGPAPWETALVQAPR